MSWEFKLSENQKLAWYEAENEVEDEDSTFHKIPVSIGADGICTIPTTRAEKPALCGVMVQKGPKAGTTCRNIAGQSTNHPGIGECVAHGGSRKVGKAKGAWLMAHAFAKALDVTPWDALLGQIRLLAGQVYWLQQKLGATLEVEGDEGLLGGEDYQSVHWALLLEQRGERLAKTSKMAIDAGIAERMIQNIESQAAMLYSAAQATAQELGFDEDKEYELMATLAKNFEKLEREQGMKSIEADIVEE